DRHCRFCRQFVSERQQRPMIEGRTLDARRKDGTRFPAAISLHSYELNGERFAVATVRDMSEQLRLRAAVETNLLIQDAINRILQASLEPIGLDELLNRALDLVLSMPWFATRAAGAIYLTEGAGGPLVMKAQRGLPSEVVRHCARVAFGHCLCGRAAQHRKVVFADRLDERHEFRYPGECEHGHYCVPILIADRVHGVITVFLNGPRHSRKREEEELLSAVAQVLAATIERKRAEAALRRSEE